ncbi:hypothetical protein ACFLZJ_00140 [Nanoarchaeota archaeon]
MADENYDKILDKISRVSGVDKAELQRRVEAKRAKLSGLISKEGASQIIAAELGISFDNEKLKIDELLPGMRKANVLGKVIKLSPVRSFTTKRGEPGKVANLVIADETSNIKVVLWDTNHIALIEKGDIIEGKSIEINNGNMRDNELHLGSFSEFKLSGEVFENVRTEKIVKEKKVSELKLSDSASVRAFVVQAFEPKFFYVCPECSKKATQEEPEVFSCVEHGKVIADRRALINIVLDDGTESIRTVIFHEGLKGIGITAFDDPEQLIKERENLLGKEMVFSGDVRMNKFFNNPEFIIDGVQELDHDALIAKLEEKA